MSMHSCKILYFYVFMMHIRLLIFFFKLHFFKILFHEVYMYTPHSTMRPTLKIFLFPLTRPGLTDMGRSVGFFFSTSQIGYPLNIIHTVKPVLRGHSTKDKKLFVLSKPIIAYCRAKVLQNAPREHSAILLNCI